MNSLSVIFYFFLSKYKLREISLTSITTGATGNWCAMGCVFVSAGGLLIEPPLQCRHCGRVTRGQFTNNFSHCISRCLAAAAAAGVIINCAVVLLSAVPLTPLTNSLVYYTYNGALSRVCERFEVICSDHCKKRLSCLFVAVNIKSNIQYYDGLKSRSENEL